MTGVMSRSRTLLGVLSLGCLASLLVGDVPPHGTATATVLATAGTARLRGVRGLLSGLVIGALLGAGIGYAVATTLQIPLSVPGAASLGLALGGGLGVVTNYLATGDEGTVDETMTVEREPQQGNPTPADLFDTHPDPILYVADEGHGPVVRAANAAYGETFDVPTDAVIGAPLEEAVLAGPDTASVADAVAADDPLETVVTCETADGTTDFRLRTAGDGADSYLVYTPVEN